MPEDIAQKDHLIAEASDLLRRRVVATVEEALERVCLQYEEGFFCQMAIEAATRHLRADFGFDDTEIWLRENDPLYELTSIGWRR